jgi:hypothetical protein
MDRLSRTIPLTLMRNAPFATNTTTGTTFIRLSTSSSAIAGAMNNEQQNLKSQISNLKSQI